MGFPVVSTVLRKVFGTRNDRMVKRYLRVVDEVNTFEDQITRLTDGQLRAQTDEFRKKLQDGAKPTDVMP